MLDTKNPLAPITVGSGFIVTVNPAIVLNNGTPTSIPSTIISLTASATNYIHITSGGVLTVNTTGFPAACLPIATVTCSSTSVTSVVDSRPDFYLSSTAGIPNTLFQPWGGLFGGASAGVLSGANKIQISGFYLPNAVSFTNLIVNITAADAGNNYDWGIYDSSGSLKAHVGARTVAGTGISDIAVVGGTVSLSVGKYYLAFTGAAATATLSKAPAAAQAAVATFLALTESVTTSSGGSLPSSITIPADTWVVASTNVHGFTLHS